ncbi:MAG: 16S rRNA (cytosine(1402)-N(4))-methyltransferase RsmH [Patescibacteria group bacterium]
MAHASVLLQETIKVLAPQEGDVVLDGTVGNGGHAEAIIPLIGKKGTYIGLDADAHSIERASKKLSGASSKVILRKENFRNLDAVLREEGISSIDRILLDLGLNSDQLEVSGRGFSFLRDEPLIMTYDDLPLGVKTARDIVNQLNEKELADLIFNFGEERLSRRIAFAIVQVREKKPIERSRELAALIEACVPSFYRHGRIHPATRTFQALRIVVNDEMGALEEGLHKGFEALSSGGVMAVISFHSLEDRMVKNFFRDLEKGGKGEVLVKKPIVSGEEEQSENPRSRSAKLRSFKKI